MALNKANMSWSAKQITKMANKGTFSFDNIIQRSYVWEQARKSNLIHSMIEGYPIPPFYAKKVDGKTYDFLDGKQRMGAIQGYINNTYTLAGVPDVTYTDNEGNEVTISLEGKTFNDLPEELQDAINDYHLTVYYYEDISPEQVRILFAKLNNGKPLSTKERNIANCIDIKTVTDLGNHPIFTDTFTEKAKETRKQLPIVMKIWMMLNKNIEEVSFASKDFNPVMQETVMTDGQKNKIVSVLNKFYETYKLINNAYHTNVAKEVGKKMLSETHMVSLIPFFAKATEQNIDDRLLADFIVELFCDNLVSDEYQEACKNGSAKNVNIIKRHREIEKQWARFFKEDEPENNENNYFKSEDKNDQGK